MRSDQFVSAANTTPYKYIHIRGLAGPVSWWRASSAYPKHSTLGIFKKQWLGAITITRWSTRLYLPSGKQGFGWFRDRPHKRQASLLLQVPSNPSTQQAFLEKKIRKQLSLKLKTEQLGHDGKTPKTNLQNPLGSDHTAQLGRVTRGAEQRKFSGSFCIDSEQETCSLRVVDPWGKSSVLEFSTLETGHPLLKTSQEKK